MPIAAQQPAAHVTIKACRLIDASWNRAHGNSKPCLEFKIATVPVIDPESDSEHSGNGNYNCKNKFSMFEPPGLSWKL